MRRLGPRRVAGVVGVCLALALVAACGAPASKACTLIGGTSRLTVSFPSSIRAQLARVRVELCQASRCEGLTVRSIRPDPRYLYVQRGVSLDEANTYAIDLRALGGGWKPDVRTRLTVVGVTGDGSEAVSYTDSFRFSTTYPNGKDCDVTPYLSHRVRVGENDGSRQPTRARARARG